MAIGSNDYGVYGSSYNYTISTSGNTVENPAGKIPISDIKVYY